uniref:Methylenetetrahydrofolate reductase (NAD(P)H) n=1 Tax=Acrobeloides nanus TaxID=290746 RepID=A0A914CHV5_9BILA
MEMPFCSNKFDEEELVQHNVDHIGLGWEKVRLAVYSERKFTIDPFIAIMGKENDFMIGNQFTANFVPDAAEALDFLKNVHLAGAVQSVLIFLSRKDEENSVTPQILIQIGQELEKYSINYGIVPPPPSTSENYKTLIKIMCAEKTIGRVVQTVDDGRNFG